MKTPPMTPPGKAEGNVRDWKPRTLAAQALGRIDEATPRRGAADPCRDHLHPRPGQPVSERQHLRPARQRDGARGRGFDRGARRGGGGDGVRLRHVGRDGVVPGALAGRSRRRAEGDVLVAPQLAHDRGHALGAQGRPGRDIGPRRGAGGGQAGRDEARLDRDAVQPALVHHRHRGGRRKSRMRPARCWRSTRPRPRRC